MMCVPLLIPDHQPVGIIQVDTTDRKQFSREDLDVLAGVALLGRCASRSKNSQLHIALGPIPDAATKRSPDSKAPIGQVNPASESIRRHTDISFPARVHVGKSYNLRVQIIPAEKTLPTGEVKELAKPHDHDATMLLDFPKPAAPEEPPPDICVTIDVAAENFEIDGPASAEIVVPLLEKSPAAVFRLRGREVGPGRVMIDLAQSGRPVGSVDLSPEVVSIDHEDTPCRAATGGELNLGTGPGLDAPDLVIKVFEYRHAGQAGRLQFGSFHRQTRG